MINGIISVGTKAAGLNWLAVFLWEIHMTRERYRSPEAKLYRPMYKTPQWKALRKLVISRDLYTCQHKGCGCFVAQGRKHPRSAVVHHIKPHKGDAYLFYDASNLELVCKHCHDGAIQSSERRGYDSTVGVDGWPIDHKHPQHNKRVIGRGLAPLPTSLSQFKIPVVSCVLVCGAPGSGKTTYATDRFNSGDIIIDLDDYKEAVGGVRWDTNYIVTLKAIALRNKALAQLHEMEHGIVWVVLGGRIKRVREAWADALGGASIVVMPTSMQECVRRVQADSARSHALPELIPSIKRWFHAQ
ncbi:MAG: HNH endonuclease [Rhodobacteraceae bacterium]|nr:HNH endonuclease [Paracoccaceae bacterium]